MPPRLFLAAVSIAMSLGVAHAGTSWEVFENHAIKSNGTGADRLYYADTDAGSLEDFVELCQEQCESGEGDGSKGACGGFVINFQADDPTEPDYCVFKLADSTPYGIRKDAYLMTVGADPEHGDEITIELPGGEQLEMIYIGPGGDISEGFYLGKYEVTQAQWEGVMGNNPSTFSGANRPVEGVAWDDVQDFLAQLSEADANAEFRLPTRDEWEYAYLAGADTDYSFGDDASEMDEYAWYKGNTTHTQDVGTKLANAWGLYDMNGNIGELTSDGRSYKGGSWQSTADWMQYNKGTSASSKGDFRQGFRLLMIK